MGVGHPKADILTVGLHLLRLRANTWRISFRSSLQWTIYIIVSVDCTKLCYRLQLASQSLRGRQKNCRLLLEDQGEKNQSLICLSSKIDTNITTENLVTGNPVYFNFCLKNYFYQHKSVSKGPKICLSSVLSSMQKLSFLKKQTMQVKVKPSFFDVDRAGITGFIYQWVIPINLIDHYPFTLMISLVILLTVCYTLLVISVLRIWHWIKW